MKRKLIAALLCFTMVISTGFPLIRAAAANSDLDMTSAEQAASSAVNYTNVAPFLPPVEGTAPKMLRTMSLLSNAKDGSDEENSLIMNKNVSAPDEDGVYTLTLEAYATGEKIVETVSKDVPTDIILVLDQSGSMDENFTNGVTKLNALKSAVTSFTNAVYAKAKGTDGVLGTDDDVNHRIAMVGFASGTYYNRKNYNYGNTELFIGGTQYTYNAGSYNNASNANSAQSHYSSAFQDMDTEAGYNNIIASKNALAADGGTIINLGMEMANGIYENNAIASGEQRNRVVIVFTDGVPGWSGYDSDVANSAITQAATLKSTYGATVYTIGVFSGADATSAGNEYGRETEKANWFMQNLSSNGGTVQDPSYYLSANDATALNNIFQQISDEISTGGSSVSLDESAVVKDVVSDYFDLPDGAKVSDIKVYTEDYTAENTFTNKQDFDATISINEKTISVSNFNFKDNWVGKETNDENVTYRGKKLIIEIPVVVREGFLGGNGIPTNGDGSGIYENSTATEAVKEFISPTVDVEIKDITITTPEKNVYLYGGLTQEQLMDGVIIYCGNVRLDPDAANYGLESWQNAYVNITVTKPAEYSKLDSDTLYNVFCKVEPKKGDGITEKTGSSDGSINVFLPELTFKDSQVYYGDIASYGDSNKVSEVWKHNDTLSTAEGISMIGSKPDLSLSYAAGEGVKDGKVVTTEDIPVTVAVAIGTNDATNKTIFKHDSCAIDPQCGFNKDTEQFLLHVKTCTLNIIKAGWDKIDENASYIFHIEGNNEAVPVELDVVVHGNGTATIVGLPVGSYTVTENSDWSWRYQVDVINTTNGATLSDSVPAGVATITNSRKNVYWLDGYYWIKNIFDGNKTVKKPGSSN